MSQDGPEKKSGCLWKAGEAAITGAVGIFIGILGTLTTDWAFRPDVRYEEGAYYRTGKTAVTSLKLHNYGNRSSEDIRITADFSSPLVEPPTTSDENYPFERPLEKGDPKGRTRAGGKISRLEPGQTLYVYFAIENTGSEPSQHFIRQVISKNGLGQPGPPVPFWNVSSQNMYSMFLWLGIVI
jgi:hypothetical protein